MLITGANGYIVVGDVRVKAFLDPDFAVRCTVCAEATQSVQVVVVEDITKVRL